MTVFCPKAPVNLPEGLKRESINAIGPTDVLTFFANGYGVVRSSNLKNPRVIEMTVEQARQINKHGAGSR